jgi:hypothetical protein
MGRPRKKESEKRKIKVMVNLSIDEWVKIQRRADLVNKPLARWIREQVVWSSKY